MARNVIFGRFCLNQKVKSVVSGDEASFLRFAYAAVTRMDKC